jgi:hypothetical protein
MKKTNLFGMFVAAIILSSCSSDDNNNSSNESAIPGVYEITQVNTATATDFDGNGASHTDQTVESHCYDGSKITLGADHTFNYVHNYILVDTANLTASCTSETFTGTWAVTNTVGTTFVVRATYTNASNAQETLDFVTDGHISSYFDVSQKYPNKNTTGGAIYTSGPMQYVFEKQ